MKKYIVILLLTILAACGEHKDSYAVQQQTDPETGLTFQQESNSTHTLADLVLLYKNAMDCSGIAAPGPRVLERSALSDSTALLNTNSVLITPHATAADINHQFLHTLLAAGGILIVQNQTHNHAVFTECALPVPK